MEDARGWLERLVRAVNDHDLDALSAVFAPDYENVTPAHPSRGFVGRDQVARNWQQIFGAVPDIRAEIVAAAFDGPTCWTQLDMSGTRVDGSPHHMAGVVVFDVADGLARKATFFLEPVEEDAGSVDDAIRQVLR